MWKKAHFSLLGLSIAFEAVLTVLGFVVPGFALSVFKLPLNPETLFLGHVLAWCFLLITVFCGLALKEAAKGHRIGWTMSQILSIWWIGIGLVLFLKFGRKDPLILDTAKGALLFVSARKSLPRSK